jgi:Family of unknown function (DUF6529)
LSIREDARRRSANVALAAIAAGAVVAVALGVYGREHTPTGRSIFTFGFSTFIQMKVWLTVVVGVLALFQLVTALWMYGRLGGAAAPRWVPPLHRALGAAAVIVSLPVAFHCLWSLGFQTYSTRVVIHSLMGCLFYGAFVTKVVAVQSPRGPRWLLPVAGGVLFTVLVAIILTSAVWFLTTIGLPTPTSGY